MSSFPTLPSGDRKVKSFWERPEGTFGMLVAGAGAVAAVIALNAALPFLLGLFAGLVQLTTYAIALGLLAAIAGVLGIFIFNKKTWLAVGIIYKMTMRKIFGMIVEIDPIGIMKNYVSELKGRLGDMDSRIKLLNGQIAICNNQILQNNKVKDNAMKIAVQAKKNIDSGKLEGNVGAFRLNARRAGRLNETNMTYEQLLIKMNMLYKMLSKYREAADITIQDMEDEIDVKKKQRDTIIASYGAMKAAEDILRGSGDKKELFDQAMEFVAEDYGRKLGEIEDFMSTSQGFIDTLDLQQQAFDGDALDKIAEWEKKADSLLLGDMKQLTIEDSQTQLSGIKQPSIIDVNPGDYQTYFTK
jgi:hypothetical protein